MRKGPGLTKAEHLRRVLKRLCAERGGAQGKWVLGEVWREPYAGRTERTGEPVSGLSCSLLVPTLRMFPPEKSSN